MRSCSENRMAFASPFDWLWVLAPIVVGTFAIVFLLRGLWHFAHLRLHWGGAHVVSGLVFGIVALAAALIVLNTRTFARLNYEAPVAEIAVTALDPSQNMFRVAVRRLDGSDRTATCTLQGDEWELSARIQKWKAWANILGLNATYALDQIANKYASAERGNGKTINSCALDAPAPSLNAYLPRGLLAWLLENSYAEQRRFGSAVFMPLADGALYRVTMTQTGLNADAVNPIAKAAVRSRI
jgi:hypothetical protein